MATPRKLTVTDAHLSEALAGRAYLLFDGGMGTLVQAAGLHTIHEVPDLLNLTHPDAIVAIQRQYVEAGADCITTNTFSANRLKLAKTDATVAEVYAAAAANARAAGAPLVAGDIGPTGALLEPLGTLTFDEAFDIFAEQARAAEAAGCDLIVVETMADLLEAKAAVLAAVESTALPVFATMTFGEDGRTFLGTTPAIAATTLSALGASAVGLNCSLGPVELAPLVEELAPCDRALVMAQPNAGLPRIQDGETVFDVGPDEFARAMEALLDAGATVIGGCCGTTPAHIAALRAILNARSLRPATAFPKPLYRPAFTVTSAQRMVSLPQGESRIAVIGERINPTGKKKLKAALQAGDVDYLVAEAAAQQRAGADILDVNVGVPGLDEPALLSQVVRTLQATVPLPLQLDSSDPAAIEAAARTYAGRPMVNSVNGKANNLAAVLPVVARYGCTVVGLTLDENGIPPTAEERLAIAERIVNAASAHGIPREDVAIDCLVMAAATNQNEVREILRAVTLVKERLGVRTVLGVSNVSFGLPARPLVNSTFLAAAFGAGLDMPILNPLNARYRDTVATFRILNGQDAGCRAFLETYASTPDPYEIAASPASAPAASDAACAQNVVEGAASAASAAARARNGIGGAPAAPSDAACVQEGRRGADPAPSDAACARNASGGAAAAASAAACAQEGRRGADPAPSAAACARNASEGATAAASDAACARDTRSGEVWKPASAANDAACGTYRGNDVAGGLSVRQGPIPVTDNFADAADTVVHLAECVLEGRGKPVATATEQLLETHDGLAVINDIFVPVLDVVGQKYEDGTFFLPQLMASAEAVKAGFDIIRDRTREGATSGAVPVGGDLGRPSAPIMVAPREGGANTAPTEGNAPVGTTPVGGELGRPSAPGAPDVRDTPRAIIVATVQGDIHDIGKNIVKMLLENYGFTVIDLGRDVAPEAILDAARNTGARLVGLSALMTTTVGAMERTIQLVHDQLPGVAVMVGGAVITQEFADQIGADFYAKDAAASARVASAFFDD